MAAKQLIFSEDARRRLQQGIDVVAQAVAPLLAPRAATWPWIASLDSAHHSPTMA